MSDDIKELHVVFGTGALGQAVAHELFKRDKQVRMVNRSGHAVVPAGIEVVAADATDAASVRRVSEGAAVVYNCTGAPYTKWPELFPPIWKGITEGVAGTGAKLVIGDNLYMYGPVEGPLHEELPYRAHGRKGRTRALMAEAALGAHKRGEVQVVLGRGADFFGPFVAEQRSVLDEGVFRAALAGKPVSFLFNPDQPHTYTYVRDFGKALVVLGEHETAFGRAWHVPNAPAVTTREFIGEVYRQVGHEPRLKVMSKPVFSVLAHVVPILKEMREMVYEFKQPYVVDDSAFKAAFGDLSTPRAVAISETLDWLRQREGMWMQEGTAY